MCAFLCLVLSVYLAATCRKRNFGSYLISHPVRSVRNIGLSVLPCRSAPPYVSRFLFLLSLRLLRLFCLAASVQHLLRRTEVHDDPTDHSVPLVQRPGRVQQQPHPEGHRTLDDGQRQVKLLSHYVAFICHNHTSARQQKQNEGSNVTAFSRTVLEPNHEIWEQGRGMLPTMACI